MTTFDLIVLLVTTTIVIMLLFFGVVWKLLDDIKGWQKSIWQEQRGIRVNVGDTAEYLHSHIVPDIKCILSDTLVLKAYFNSLLERFDNITDEGGTLQQQLNDLAVNVKGNYNTLEGQQEDIYYIRTRINHILSLMHPAEEVIKPDVPTALDGLSNVPKDNANKSTNYKGYDPTIIVRGSEITDKED